MPRTSPWPSPFVSRKEAGYIYNPSTFSQKRSYLQEHTWYTTLSFHHTRSLLTTSREGILLVRLLLEQNFWTCWALVRTRSWSGSEREKQGFCTAKSLRKVFIKFIAHYATKLIIVSDTESGFIYTNSLDFPVVFPWFKPLALHWIDVRQAQKTNNMILISSQRNHDINFDIKFETLCRHAYILDCIEFER